MTPPDAGAGSGEPSGPKVAEVPRATIVVRCFNEAKHIGRLLYGVMEQDRDDLEVIVVDSGSTDGTVEIAQQFPVRMVHITPEEFSFGRALNLGCAEAKGEFLVFVSAHVYPTHRDWLTNLLAPFENPKIGASYGKQRGAPETKYSEHQIFAHWFPEESIPVQDTPFCNNANCAIRRSLWEDLPYDEELTGLEDLAWGRQIMERGHRISYVAEAEVVHVHEETPRKIKNRYMREAIALRNIYPEQRMSFADFLGLFLKNTATDYAHAAVDRKITNNLVDIPVFRFMQFFGAYRGMQQSGPVSERLKRTFYYPRNLPAKNSSNGDSQRARQRIDYDMVYHEAADVD